MSDKDFVQYLSVFGSDFDSDLAYEILKKVVSCHLFFKLQTSRLVVRFSEWQKRVLLKKTEDPRTYITI